MAKYTAMAKRNISIKLVLTCMLWYTIAANGLRYTSLSHKVPYGAEIQFFRGDRYLVSPGLAYGFCKFPSEHENLTETTCTFAMETNSKVGSPEHIRMCNTTHSVLFDDEHHKYPGINQGLYAIDKDKVLYLTGYRKFINASILHFSNCRVVPVNLKLGNLELVWPQAPFDGVFDIILHGRLKSRITVDFEGNVVEERQDWLPVSSDAVVVHSPLKGRLVVNEYGFIGELLLAAYNADGTRDILKEYTSDKVPFNSSEGNHVASAFSSTHKLLSICRLNNLTITCEQLDPNAVLKFETNVTIEKSINKIRFNAYNLQGGGLILVSYRCVREAIIGCLEIEDDIVVKKIDNTGREVGSLHITEFSRIILWNLRHLHFFENEHGEMCLSALDQSYEDNSITISVVCFKNEEFLV